MATKVFLTDEQLQIAQAIKQHLGIVSGQSHKSALQMARKIAGAITNEGAHRFEFFHQCGLEES